VVAGPELLVRASNAVSSVRHPTTRMLRVGEEQGETRGSDEHVLKVLQSFVSAEPTTLTLQLASCICP